MSDAKVSVSTVLGGLGVVSLAGLGYYLIRSQTSTSKPHSNKSNNKSNKSKSTSSKAGQHQKDNEDETSSSPGLKPKSVHRGFSVVASERSDGLPRSRAASREDAADPSAAVRRLQEENLRLRRLVTLSDVVEVDPEEKKAAASTNVPLTASEVETIRAFFDLFDTGKNGAISINDIRALHQKLGEPLTEDEAQDAMRDLDKKGKGEVNFEEFLAWWYANHKNNKGDRYTARFKLIASKLTDEFQIDRVVRTAVGKQETLEYRVMFQYKQKNGTLKRISPWHDVPLYSVGRSLDAKIFNFICEIPKYTRAKFEIATGEPYNPIKQDVKNGKLRYLKHGDMLFNYGAFPRTWEDPKYVPDDTKCPGDNDPIDVFELGTRQLATGTITPVKILGVMALIDDGETDWKVIAININDPLAHLLNDVDDVEAQLPGAIHAIREYMRLYKVWQGNPENEYALRGEAMHRDYAIRVVEECHKHWQHLADAHQTTVTAGNHSAAAAIPDVQAK